VINLPAPAPNLEHLWKCSGFPIPTPPASKTWKSTPLGLLFARLVTLVNLPLRHNLLSAATALLAVWLACVPVRGSLAGTAVTNGLGNSQQVLLIFSESRDLPGSAMMEQAIRTKMMKGSTNRIDFFTESLDAGHFPNAKHYRLFRDYIKNKYAGQDLDLVVMFMSRDFVLARELPATLMTNLPTLFVVVNDLAVPDAPGGRPYTGIFQRFDVEGTVKFIFRLQPDTRRVVVIGGTSPADQAVLDRIQQTAQGIDGVAFEFWTNRPIAEDLQAAKKLPGDTVILVSTLQRDATSQPMYTSQVVQQLAPAASVPVYVLGASIIGTGAVGGNVVDFDDLGTVAGQMGLKVLAGTPYTSIPIDVRSNGVPMVDWRAMQRWHIKQSRLPENCVIRYQPQSPWANHLRLIIAVTIGFLVQAITIAALLVQRRLQRLAQAEILKQRTELVHVARVSMMGQLASALTHELNQPLGAILRNAEAAEIYLQGNPPNLQEIRAILTDIRRDDKRAGNVIDRMRSLFKRQKLTSGSLDLASLVEDTIAMARPDADARQVKLRIDIAPNLPPAEGDRVHIQQVLLNLILNGMDAMNTIPKTRKSLAVTVTETENQNLKISVADCGIGISPDNAAHVFEPFFTTKSNGMGMGLAISRTIIEAHGGEIWLKSNAMEGTTFTFILPPAGADKVKPGDLPASL